MRPTSRLFATVKSASKYLEANTPTGLAGLSTHPSPRPALIYTYRQTLKKLEQLPKASVYRQSAEALTKQRLQIVESTIPEGHAQWLERVRKQIEASPKAYSHMISEGGTLAAEVPYVESVENWDGKITKFEAQHEGTNSKTLAEEKAKAVDEEIKAIDVQIKEGILPTVDDLEVEPPLSRDQIDEIEKKVGAGLIEEVINVAEGELILASEMLEHQVWDELEEKSPTGQWNYFER